MTYAYETLYRKTRLLVDAYVRTRRNGQTLSAQDLASDPSVVRAMQTLHQDIVNLPLVEQVALYARMVSDASRVAREEAGGASESADQERLARLQVALGLIEGYCKNLLEAAHRAIDEAAAEEEDDDPDDDE